MFYACSDCFTELVVTKGAMCLCVVWNLASSVTSDARIVERLAGMCSRLGG